MPSTHGNAVQFDRNGFLLTPERWHEALAVDIAAKNGISSLSEQQWAVIRSCANSIFASARHLRLTTSANCTI